MKRGFLVVLAAAAVLVLQPARATVYRCTIDGKTVYRDVPCAPGAAPAKLPPLSVGDRQPLGTPLEKQFDADAKRAAANKRTASAEWTKKYETKKAHDEAVHGAIVAHRVVKGMTPAEVRQAIGEPTRIEGEGGLAERWIYQNGVERRTLSFADGTLKSERNGASRRR